MLFRMQTVAVSIVRLKAYLCHLNPNNCFIEKLQGHRIWFNASLMHLQECLLLNMAIVLNFMKQGLNLNYILFLFCQSVESRKRLALAAVINAVKIILVSQILSDNRKD